MTVVKEALNAEPVNTIQSTENPYHHLLKAIDPETLKRMKGKSLGVLFFEASCMSLELTREGNKLTLVFRRETQERLNDLMKKKIDSYNQVVKNIVLPILEGSFELLSGVGAPTVQAFARMWTVAVRSSEKVLDNKHQSEITGFDHLSRSLNDTISQYTQGKQDYRQTCEAINRLIEQFMQQNQENFRAVAG